MESHYTLLAQSIVAGSLSEYVAGRMGDGGAATTVTGGSATGVGR